MDQQPVVQLPEQSVSPGEKRMEAPVENEPAAAERRWWLRMLLWSAGLVAVGFITCFAAYNGPLYYYAWKWRKVNPDDKRDHYHSREEVAFLEKAARIIVARRVVRGKAMQLLGHPSREHVFDGDHWLNYFVGPGPEHEISLCFKEDRATFLSVNLRTPAVGKWGPAKESPDLSRTPAPEAHP